MEKKTKKNSSSENEEKETTIEQGNDSTVIDNDHDQSTIENPESTRHQLDGDKELQGKKDLYVALNIHDHNDENTSQAKIKDPFRKENLVFSKKLTKSDARRQQARLLIPHQDAETHFFTSRKRVDEEMTLELKDEENRIWEMTFKRYASSNSYAITREWSKFLKEHPGLEEGDVVKLYKTDQPQRDKFYLIKCEKAEKRAEDQRDKQGEPRHSDGKQKLIGDKKLQGKGKGKSVAFTIRGGQKTRNNENTSQTAIKSQFKAENRLFQMSLSASDVSLSRAKLLLPTEDAETDFAFVKRTVSKQKTVKFRGDENISWTTELLFDKPNNTYTNTDGRSEFLIDHPSLREGDQAKDESKTETSFQFTKANLLFRKKLSKSDVCLSTAKLIIPTEDAETHFAFVKRSVSKPPLLVFRDDKNRPIAMRITFSKSDGTYAISFGWDKFLTDHHFLQEGNEIEFYVPEHPRMDMNYLISWKKAAYKANKQSDKDYGDVYIDGHKDEGNPKNAKGDKGRTYTITENEQSNQQVEPRHNKSDTKRKDIVYGSNEQGDDKEEANIGERDGQGVDGENEESAIVESESGYRNIYVNESKLIISKGRKR